MEAEPTDVLQIIHVGFGPKTQKRYKTFPIGDICTGFHSCSETAFFFSGKIDADCLC